MAIFTARNFVHSEDRHTLNYEKNKGSVYLCYTDPFASCASAAESNT